MGVSAPAYGGLGCRVVQQYLWGCADKVRGQEATGKCQTSVQEGSHLGSTWNLALGLHFGSDGISRQAGLGSREPRLLALGMSRLHGLGSAVLLQPVTCLSSSLLRCSQLPDRVQVPHHHPCRVDDHCEDGFSLEATDDATRVDILGLQQGGT